VPAVHTLASPASAAIPPQEAMKRPEVQQEMSQLQVRALGGTRVGPTARASRRTGALRGMGERLLGPTLLPPSQRPKSGLCPPRSPCLAQLALTHMRH
jgi:hypothetical protein